MRVDCLSHVDVVAGHLGLVAALAQGPAGGPSSTSWPVRVRLSTTAASTNSRHTRGMATLRRHHLNPRNSALKRQEPSPVSDTECPDRARAASSSAATERRPPNTADLGESLVVHRRLDLLHEFRRDFHDPVLLGMLRGVPQSLLLGRSAHDVIAAGLGSHLVAVDDLSHASLLHARAPSSRDSRTSCSFTSMIDAPVEPASADINAYPRLAVRRGRPVPVQSAARNAVTRDRQIWRVA